MANSVTASEEQTTLQVSLGLQTLAISQFAKILNEQKTQHAEILKED